MTGKHSDMDREKQTKVENCSKSEAIIFTVHGTHSKSKRLPAPCMDICHAHSITALGVILKVTHPLQQRPISM